MKQAWMIGLSLCWLALSAQGAIDGAWVDQHQYAGDWAFGYGTFVPVGSGLSGEQTGQTFLPSVSEHAGVSIFCNETDQEVTLWAWLREGSITGPVLPNTFVTRSLTVTSPPISVGFMRGNWVDFTFDSPVLLDSQTPYVLEIISLDSVQWYRTPEAGGPYSNYPQGQAVLGSVPVTDGSDLGFMTWVVPEPATALLLAAGFAVQWRRRR